MYFSLFIYATLSAFENIEFAAQLVGMTKEDRLSLVRELLEQVGLSHRTNHLPNALSGGERQGSPARALVHKPKLILADEPTGSLDTNPVPRC